jgi:ferredoxin-thioredoxin reductase catalytic subunit
MRRQQGQRRRGHALDPCRLSEGEGMKTSAVGRDAVLRQAGVSRETAEALDLYVAQLTRWPLDPCRLSEGEGADLVELQPQLVRQAGDTAVIEMVWPQLAAIPPALAERVCTDATYAVYLDRQKADIAAGQRRRGHALDPCRLSEGEGADLVELQPQLVRQAGDFG